MTVETTVSRAQYNTNGTTGPWTVPFPFLLDDDLQVIYTDSDGNEAELVLNVTYTVTGAGGTSGTVTTTTAYAAGGYITVLRDVEPLQSTDFVDGDDLPADAVEQGFDRLTQLAQQLLEVTGRALVFAPSDTEGSTLPAAASRANLLLGFDSAGRVSLVAPVSGSAADLALSLANTSDATKGDFLIGVKQPFTGAVARTQHDKNSDFVSLLDFAGVDPTGATASTAGIQAAVNSGKRIYVPEGTYLTGQINFPNVIGGTPVNFIGAGMGKVVFVANAANITLFRKVNTSGSIDGAVIGGFSVKPHASGSTAPAVMLTGFRTSRFSHIQGLSNGTKGFYSLFDVAAYPWLCYRNTIEFCSMDGTQGYTKGIDFNNGGTSNALNNSNIARITDCWFNQNAGMATLIDATRSAKVVIDNCIFEACTGATAVASGNTTTIRDNWFELNGADISYPTLADGTANDGLVTGNYFSTAHTISFLGVSGNVWLNNTEAGAQTWTNNNGANVRFAASQLYNITAPTIAYTSGQTGVLALVGAVQRQTDMSGSLTWLLRYSWTAGAAPTNTKFTITIPSGWAISQTTAECFRNSSGEPMKTGVTASAEVWIKNEYTDAHEIVVTVTATKIN